MPVELKREEQLTQPTIDEQEEGRQSDRYWVVGRREEHLMVRRVGRSQC